MKKGSADIVAITLFSLLLASLTFAALKDIEITGMAFLEGDEYGIASDNCGGIVPCYCGDTVTSSYTMSSDLSCAGIALIVSEDDIIIDCAGHNIAGDGTAYGLYITEFNNITIFNCTVYDFSRGIYARLSTNHTLYLNNASLNDYGIYLENVAYTNISNNTANENTADGIFLTHSDYNTGHGNTGYGNLRDGIRIENSSDSNLFRKNTAIQNGVAGIHIYNNSKNNVIKNNNVTLNVEYGISVEYTQNNSITGNTANDNTRGIFVYFANNNTVTNNTAQRNSLFGALLYSAYNNTVENNELTNNIRGLKADSSDYNRIINNNASYNTEEGMYINGSADYNMIINNTAKNNNLGISLAINNNNRLINNTAKNNNQGIHLYSSEDNYLIQNNASYNTQRGIWVRHFSYNNSLINNTANNNFLGIYLDDRAKNNTLTNNTASYNTGYGIFLSDNADNNTLTNNIANLNTYYGIYILTNSNKNTLIENTANNNDYGIYLDDNAKHNTLTNNTANLNTDYGIRLTTNSNNNTLIGNKAYNNSNSGIRVSSSSLNVLINNKANNNSIYGIYLTSSSLNVLINNTAKENDYGIYLGFSDYNELTNNTAENNTPYDGIRLYYSDNNMLIQNKARYNTGHGIFLSDSDYNTGYLNTGYGNLRYGIYLYNSENNTLTNNTANENNESGIFLSSSIYNLLIGGELRNNKYGIYFNNSDNNTLVNSTILNNSIRGINMNSSDMNSIYNNFFDNNFNAYDNTTPTPNYWNTTYNCASGNNIIGKPCIGGNYWSDYKGKDTTNDWIGDTYVPYQEKDYLPLLYNSMAHLDLVILNSTYAANTTNENLTCWANSSDIDGDNATYHGFWYKNGIEQIDHKWNKTETNGGADIQAFGVSADSNNSLFVAGYYETVGGKRRMIYKYNSSGDFQKNESPTYDGVWYDIIADKEDNVIAAGYFVNVSRTEMSVIKYDNNLSEVYSAEKGSINAFYFAQGVAVDQDHNIIAAGYSNSSGNYDFLLVKYDKNLNQLWEATFDLEGYEDFAMDVAVDLNNDIIVTGRTQNGTNKWKFLTVKYYENGTYAWNSTFNISDGDRAYAVAADSNNDIFVAGKTETTNSDILIVKYNSTGYELWNKTMGDSNDENAEDIFIDSRGNIVIGATTNSIGAGKEDFWIIKLNSSGNHTWNFTFGGAENDLLYGMTADNYDDIIAAGSTKSFPTASTELHLFTVKYGGFETGPIQNGNMTPADVIDSSETSITDVWSCEVIVYDGTDYDSYQMSNDLQIISDTPPKWSDNKTRPASPTTYVYGQVYQFNVTWENNIFIDTVFIQNNFTNGTVQNDTVIYNNGDEYYIEFANINAGTYAWKMHANDTAGLWNQTDQWTYTVNKATPTCSLTFDKTSPQIYGATVNASCSCTNTDLPIPSAKLYRDGVNVTATENDKSITLAAENYTYVCNASETQNYVSASNTSQFNITRASSGVNLTLDGVDGAITVEVYSIVNITAERLAGEGIIELYQNGTLINSGTGPLQNLTNYTQLGDYNLTVIYPLTENYTGSSETHILTVEDSIAPQWLEGLGNKTSYPSGVVYLKGRDYQFKVIWTDNFNLSDVIIEHNFSGNLLNYSITGNISSQYYYNYSDLAAGNYAWKMYANDTSGNLNFTDQWSYSIEKATPTCTLSLSSNSLTYGEAVTANCSCTNPETNAILWRNGTDKTSSENGTSVVLAAGTGYYVCNASSTQNYTYAQSDGTVTVSKATPTLSLTVDPGWDVTYGNYTNVSCNASTYQATPMLYRNGVSVSADGDYAQLGSNNYTYVCNNSETQNYTYAQSDDTLIVSKAGTTLNLTAVPSWNITYPTQTNVSCNASNTEVTVELFRNETNVSNPDRQTLNPGIYTYKCRANATQNYTGEINETDLTVNPVPPAPTVSRGGGGARRCISECVLGEARCVNESTQESCMYDAARGCWLWFTVQCEANEKCQDGVCAECIENWICDDWSECIGGLQTRECADWNNCGTYNYMPSQTRGCAMPPVEEEIPVEEAPEYIPPLPPEEEVYYEVEEKGIEEYIGEIAMYSLGALALVLLAILAIVIVARRKTNFYSFIGKRLRKGYSEPAIEKDVMEKGYTKKDADSMLKEIETKKLIELIEKHKAKGFKTEQVREALVIKGWNPDLVEKAVSKLSKK